MNHITQNYKFIGHNLEQQTVTVIKTFINNFLNKNNGIYHDDTSRFKSINLLR